MCVSIALFSTHLVFLNFNFNIYKHHPKNHNKSSGFATLRNFTVHLDTKISECVQCASRENLRMRAHICVRKQMHLHG